ncbi:MAG TPA: TIGR00300 family protein [Ardenticatenaceae bacterium]|nr:TIGR00300 family protein [Ardenticatenaceae bacterium]
MSSNTYPVTEEIKLRGHIIDSWVLPRVWDTIMDMGGDFDVLDFRVGKHRDEPSYAHLRVRAPDTEMCRTIMAQLQELGAELVSEKDVETQPAPRDGALPADFYSTTNLVTHVRISGQWVPVEGTEMDLAIVVDREQGRAATRPMVHVRKGETVVVGHEGIRVLPLERARESEVFSFMNSAVSSEKPKKLVIHEIAREMREIKLRGGRILVVAGPAIVHSGAGPYLGELIRDGYVDVLFGGNAIATHDVEAALFGTSLGVNLESGIPVEGGHRHHMRALNTIRAVGSLRAAVEQGILIKGIMYEAITKGITMVLAGSIRDDGPMPDVITDVMVAQDQMRAAVQGVEMVLMISSMLHSIATGNLLPASVKTVAVDINPAVVTKLADRGSWQAVGLVTDAELFLRELALALAGHA